MGRNPRSRAVTGSSVCLTIRGSGPHQQRKLIMATSVWRKFQNVWVSGKLKVRDSSLELNGTAVDATATELNQVADASARVVTTTATALSLTVAAHAERVVLINTDSTVANTFTLPAATGSGAKFTIVNNIVQTQGTVVVAANGTDVLTGKAKAFDSTAVTAAAEVFLTSATSDKISLNLTTSGGLGYDTVEALDVAANTYLVDVEYTASGNIVTPFSAT